MLAPSIEFSTSSSLPLPQPTPVRQAGTLLTTIADLDSQRAATPTACSTLSDEAQAALEISPASMKIDPALFTPTKRRRAIALHLHYAHLDTAAILHPPGRISPILAPDPDPTLPTNIPAPIQPHTPLLLPPELDEQAILKAENEHLQRQLQNAQQGLHEKTQTIRTYHAQLLIQDRHCTDLQKRLNAKGTRKRKDTHLSRYLDDGGERVFTAEGYRAAVRADRDKTRQKNLDQVQRSAVAAAKKARSRWRKEQKDKRAQQNAHQLRRWEEQCAENQADGTRKPPKPKRAAKAQTPERFARTIRQAGALTGEQLLRMAERLEDVGQGDARQQAILQFLESPPDGLPSGSESEDTGTD
ncbi:hypothetical protein BN946_scf184932.g1 [Trametes cinnabarina]|uniref:Uncharacterized protein n=1 Tax=Pycnoporus cinnabarinus TaxID=5643 RepID=A0A060SLP6_PYCCI|nr:hypothetical protein BN946_scf184932.g1 [Trametes cinnabarina]